MFYFSLLETNPSADAKHRKNLEWPYIESRTRKVVIYMEASRLYRRLTFAKIMALQGSGEATKGEAVFTYTCMFMNIKKTFQEFSEKEPLR